MISTIPRGTAFLRSAIARAAAGRGDPVEYTRARFGDRNAAITKAAVGAGTLNSGGWGEVLATPEATEYMAAVSSQSIVGKLNLRPVPLNVRLVSATSGFTAYWVGRGASKPLSKAAYAGSTLSPLKIAGMYVNTQELFRNTSSEAEAFLRNELMTVCVKGLDEAFIDPSNTGVTDVMPASVTSTVVPIPSSSNPATDIAALFAAFTGDFTRASFVTDPVTAAGIALSRDVSGSFAFPDASPRGGSLLGLPLIVSNSSPHATAGGQLALIDGSGVALGLEGVRMTTSEQTSLELLDDPTNDSAAGTATTMVSLFQTDARALLIEIVANWQVVRPGSVVLVTGASYATAAP